MPERVTPHLRQTQRDALERYLDELELWNRRINLSAVPRDRAWSRHVEESLRLMAAAPPPHRASVVDVGSGGGIPGIVIAVVRPDVSVDLLEADTRKAAFLSHVAGLLGLASVGVVGRRAEEACREPGYREAYAAAFSRAAAPAAQLCELALPLVRVGGSLAALVADAGSAARECSGTALLVGGGTPRAVSDTVLVVPKVAPTPARFPRRRITGARPAPGPLS